MPLVSPSYYLDLEDQRVAINPPPGFSESESRQRFERALDLFQIGVNLEEEGDFEKAICFYSEALESNPEMSPAYLRRGKLLLESGKYESALNDFFAYRRQQPQCPRVLLYLSRVSSELYKTSGDEFHKNNSKRYLDWAIQKNTLYGVFRANEN